MQSAFAAAQLSLIAAARAWETAGNALDVCQTKGWIRTLTPEDCRRDKARWADEPNRAFEANDYQPGNIDFTEAGAQLWNRIRNEEAEDAEERVEWGIRCAWRFAGQARIFSRDKDKLTTCVEAFLSGKKILLSDPHHITRVEGPFALGEWWIDRFTRLPQGYRMDIYHTLEPEQT